MTGKILREKLPHEFHTKKDLEKTIENLVNLQPDHRGARQVVDLIKIVKQMDFFKDQSIPMADEDALQIAKRLKYHYVPKG